MPLYDAKVSKSSHVCHAWLELSTAQLHEALFRCMCHFRDVSFEVALSRRFGRKFRRGVGTSRRPVQLGLRVQLWAVQWFSRPYAPWTDRRQEMLAAVHN